MFDEFSARGETAMDYICECTFRCADYCEYGCAYNCQFCKVFFVVGSLITWAIESNIFNDMATNIDRTNSGT